MALSYSIPFPRGAMPNNQLAKILEMSQLPWGQSEPAPTNTLVDKNQLWVL